MLVVNYNGNKPVSDYFKYSVQGNNNADIVRFVLLKQQGNLDLSGAGYTAYAKVQTPELDFADKVMLTTKSVFGNNLVVDWALLALHTQYKQLQVSISFEDETNEVVWQTQLFTMNIANGVNADQEIPNIYPSVIQQMQGDIATKGKKLYQHLISSIFSGTRVDFRFISTDSAPLTRTSASYSESSLLFGAYNHAICKFDYLTYSSKKGIFYLGTSASDKLYLCIQCDFLVNGTTLEQGVRLKLEEADLWQDFVTEL